MQRYLVFVVVTLLLGCPRSQEVADVAGGRLDRSVPGDAPTLSEGTSLDGADSEPAGPQGPVELDLLFVVDNSASMCHEQYALGRSIDSFVSGLQALPQLDLRLAVVGTHNVVPAGRFVFEPASGFPPACIESKTWPCLGEQDCIAEFGDGWECKAYAASQTYNMNGSVNSSCIFKCDGDEQCCAEFCHADECDGDVTCLEAMCVDAPTQECTYECNTPEGGGSGNGCKRPPDTADCPAAVPPILTLDNIDLFKCLVSFSPEQSYGANMEQGLRAAWLALDPEGPNGEQSAGFLRPDAHLLVVFVSDEDDCTIAEDFCSPNWDCDSDNDCPSGTTCKLDKRFSQLAGQEKRLCCGSIKKDYNNICTLLGEYKGAAHHQCVYDLSCKDCETDDDCDDGWYCKQGKKCRPDIFSLTNIATYQAPPGTPIFSLGAVAEYYGRFKSLREGQNKVMVAAIVGDGLVMKDEKAAYISDKCLGMEKLKKCQQYALEKAASPGCAGNPAKSGCEQFLQAKQDCIRECYIASKGNANNQTVSANSYICVNEMGKADAGLRYIRLAQMFGPNGLVSNICSPEGMEKAMTDIAGMVVSVVNARR